MLNMTEVKGQVINLYPTKLNFQVSQRHHPVAPDGKRNALGK